MKDKPSSPPRISEAEWKVMKIFWAAGEATLREAVTKLEGETDWKPRTVQSLIRRLVQKGALGINKNDTREFRYAPAVSREDCQHEESRSFLGKVFDGRLTPFVAGLVENEELSREEIENLRRVLDEAAERQARDDLKSKPRKK